jgi:hypothetical protein
MLDICRMLAADSLDITVLYLKNIGTLADWDQQQTENEIDKVLSRCKPRDGVANENIENESQWIKSTIFTVERIKLN